MKVVKTKKKSKHMNRSPDKKIRYSKMNEYVSHIAKELGIKHVSSSPILYKSNLITKKLKKVGDIEGHDAVTKLMKKLDLKSGNLL